MVLLLLVAASIWGTPLLNSHLGTRITTDRISSLLLALGAALIGGAALAFTLVMFAMQVNVERLPHGLFRRFSTDARLLTYFVSMFSIALGVTLSSLLADMISPGIAVLIAVWACLLVTALLWITYRRALLLISPWAQLQLMVASAVRSLQRSVRRASMLRPLLKNKPARDEDLPFLGPKPEFDTARATIFQLDRRWAAEAHRAVSFAVSFATRFAEVGDYETSSASLTALVQVNSGYVDAKGKTFIGSAPFASLTGLPTGGDIFISETLEQLRQYMQVALARKDEQQIEQIFATFVALTRVYLGIEYAVAGDSKHYAGLSAGYLTAAVKTVPSLKSPDVLMDGVRKVGVVGRTLVSNGMKSHVMTMSGAFHELALASLLSLQLRVVVGTIMEEYADTLFALLLSREYEVRFEAERLQGCVCQVATMLLQAPETSIVGEHSSSAKAFYSTTHMSSLSAKLTELQNEILNAKADDEDAVRVVRHVQEWVDELWKPHRDLLQVAVEKRSQLAFDLIHWISQISQMLMVIADSQVAISHLAADLRKSASWLAMTLSWIPLDKDSITLVENFGLTEQLFELARVAQDRRAFGISEQIQEVMLDRACSIAAAEARRQSLAMTIRGLCVLAVTSAETNAILDLQKRIEKRLAGENRPSQNYRDCTAKWIFETDHDMSRMGFAMGHVDQQRLWQALEACAAALRGSSEASNS